MKVYIPIASSSIDNREIVVKVSMNDQKWRFVDAKEEKPRGIKDRVSRVFFFPLSASNASF